MVPRRRPDALRPGCAAGRSPPRLRTSRASWRSGRQLTLRSASRTRPRRSAAPIRWGGVRDRPAVRATVGGLQPPRVADPHGAGRRVLSAASHSRTHPVRCTGGRDPPRAPMTCAACGTVNPMGARPCFSCGSSHVAACPSCGTPIIRGARFCLDCRAALASGGLDQEQPGGPASRVASVRQAEAERRLASVLFADPVGSTTLAESRDPRIPASCSHAPSTWRARSWVATAALA